MPRKSALGSRLRHRQVRMALYDAKGRILLLRPTVTEGRSGIWSLPGGPVRAGESREDAALRLLEGDMSLTGLILSPWLAVPPIPGFASSVALFRVPLGVAAVPNSRRYAETMLLNGAELSGLAEHFSELLSPDLKCLARDGYLFAPISSVRNSS